MTAKIRYWEPIQADSTEVAPDFYGTESDRDTTIHSFEGDGRIREFYDSLPYKKGDVVWVEDGNGAVRARILNTHFWINRYGDRIAKYQIQKETKSGLFSKTFSYTWPGYIERGYKKARENVAR